MPPTCIASLLAVVSLVSELFTLIALLDTSFGPRTGEDVITLYYQQFITYQSFTLSSLRSQGCPVGRISPGGESLQSPVGTLRSHTP